MLNITSKFLIRFIFNVIFIIIILITQFMPMPSANAIKITVYICFIGILITSLISLLTIKSISLYYRAFKIIVFTFFAIFWIFETSHFPGAILLFFMSSLISLSALIFLLGRVIFNKSSMKDFIIFDSWILLIILVLGGILNASGCIQHEIINLF